MFGRINIGVNPQHITTTFQALFEARDEAGAAQAASEAAQAAAEAALDEVRKLSIAEAQYTYWVHDGKYFRAGVRDGYTVRDEAITELGFEGEQGSAIPGQDKKDWVCLEQIKS